MLYEIKHDGFLAMLHSDSAGVRLVSRNGNTFKSFPSLCDGLQRDLKGRRCVLDGEIVCLDRKGGRNQFNELLFRRCVHSLSEACNCFVVSDNDRFGPKPDE